MLKSACLPPAGTFLCAQKVPKDAQEIKVSGDVLWYLSFAEERKYPAEGSKRISQHSKSKRHLDSADTRYYNETASDSLELPQGGFLKDCRLDKTN